MRTTQLPFDQEGHLAIKGLQHRTIEHHHQMQINIRALSFIRVRLSEECTPEWELAEILSHCFCRSMHIKKKVLSSGLSKSILPESSSFLVTFFMFDLEKELKRDPPFPSYRLWSFSSCPALQSLSSSSSSSSSSVVHLHLPSVLRLGFHREWRTEKQGNNLKPAWSLFLQPRFFYLYYLFSGILIECSRKRKSRDRIGIRREGGRRRRRRAACVW